LRFGDLYELIKLHLATFYLNISTGSTQIAYKRGCGVLIHSARYPQIIWFVVFGLLIIGFYSLIVGIASLFFAKRKKQ
jgi:hypothetical protein